MRELSRWIMRPLLRAWVASKAEDVELLPRPLDVPETHSPGFNSDRVLIFGGGPAVGWGVLSHDMALPGALGRALSRRTRRGADVYVAALPYLKVSSAPLALRAIRLHRFDAIVVTLGVNDAGALTSLASWRRDLGRTLSTIIDHASPLARIFVVGVHPIRSIPIFDEPLGSVVDAHARRMNAITAEICSWMPRLCYVPLTAPAPRGSLRFRDASSYDHWAQELAVQMAPQLDAERSQVDMDVRSPASLDSARSEADRHTALLRLGILDESGHAFDRIVAQTRDAFGVPSATFSVIDAGKLVHKVGFGDVPPSIDLQRSFAASVIQGRDALIIPDATSDNRFCDLPHVAGEPHVRFYAGFPIESPGGERIGTLNVFDTEPRAPDFSRELPLLRQLGMLLQVKVQRP